LIREMRRVGSSCSASMHACRASSTRPDIAWHAAHFRSSTICGHSQGQSACPKKCQSRKS
jgi:hypothetical protein